MSGADLSLAAYKAELAKAGFPSHTLAVDEKGTLFQPPDDDTAAASFGALPVLVGESMERDLKLKAPIGRGGMGQVLGAEQVALSRTVAVKRSLRGSKDRQAAAAALIREGRATGALEHPNIVPVYALGRTPDNDVLLVMKRIEGTTWGELLRRRPSTADDLARHLQILVDVCHAVHFAHSRGVLHRDLKPDNVMVGPFGEVYVLDWGLAVCMGSTSIPGVPHVDEASSIAGTPNYMAPEMAVPKGVLDARTDVYLLGGILHAVLTGAPPHVGATIDEILHKAWLAAPPTFGPDVPPELAALCTRALARDPAARVQTADELRLGVEEFLAHASARMLCLEATVELQALSRLVDEKRDDDMAAQRAFSAARFGYEAALRGWRGSPEAKAGLARALITMARYEIHRRHADAAAVLLREVSDAPPDVLAQLAALHREIDDEEKRRRDTERAARDADISLNRTRRAVIFLVLSLGWTAFSLWNGYAYRSGIHRPGFIEMAVANLVSATLLIVVGRRFLLRLGTEGRAGRATFEANFVQASSAALTWVALGLADVPFHVTLAVATLFLAAVIWTAGAFVERKVTFAALPVLAGFVGVLLVPGYAFDIQGVSVGLAALTALWLWRR
jgi:serine/threonine-protein kinase